MSCSAATVLTSLLKKISVLDGVLYGFVPGGFCVSEVTLVLFLDACLLVLCTGWVCYRAFVLFAQEGFNNPLFSSWGCSDVVLLHSLSDYDRVCFDVSCHVAYYFYWVHSGRCELYPC